MKICILIMAMFLALASFADEVKIDLNPSKPVAGETFQAIFRIFSDSESEPVISFTPFRVEVAGKNNYGVKTSTIYANGKFTTTREVTIIYDLLGSKPGLAGMRDIRVQIGDKLVRPQSITVDLLKEAEEPSEVFVMADVPKKNIYIGEGIIVRYYLYSKVPVNNLDIKKYPKLNKFLKRFLQEPERSERVTVDGQLYIRTQIYAAKLFPEKIGELKIDPLHLSATIMNERSGDPFGSFGFRRDAKVKNLSSEEVKILVQPLPETGKDSSFTGLIGKHEFNLQVNSTRLIVNEPLEVKLTVVGGGALENLEAPVVFKHESLEEFESNGDLKIMSADQATKVFDYTFLPKANLKIPAATLRLTYFDPDTSKYIPVELPIEELTVAGGFLKNKEAKPAETEVQINEVDKIKANTLAGPILAGDKSWKSYLTYLNLILSALALIIALGVIITKEKLPNFSSNEIPKSFKSGHFHLGEFTQWLTPLISNTGKSPVTLIKDSAMSQDAKSYFIDLLNSNDYKDYSHAKGQFKFIYQASSFKELDKYIQSVKYENTSKSS
jgi:hypothetical protein